MHFGTLTFSYHKSRYSFTRIKSSFIVSHSTTVFEVLYNFESSAYKEILFVLTTYTISLTINNSGTSIAPCGTPLTTVSSDDTLLTTLTHYSQSPKTVLNQRFNVTFMPLHLSL